MALEMKMNASNIDEYVDYVQAEAQFLYDSALADEDLEKMIENQFNDPELDQFLDSHEAETMLMSIEDDSLKKASFAPIDIGVDAPYRAANRKNNRLKRNKRFKKLREWLRRLICENKEKIEEFSKKAIKSILVSLIDLSGLLLKLAIIIIAYFVRLGLKKICPE